ncbi:MAG TPA: GNAT family N-acetyltransferase [Symbiobacteriaceae bacterium]|nr:GNAT family N-acetyltransferase [Symbiobacteriaceae bacterium]
MYKQTICLIRRRDQLLLLNRNRAPWMGMWMGPGGKMEPGESPRMCALREVREETGIALDDVRFAGLVTWDVEGGRSGGMYAFVADVQADFGYPSPRASSEGLLDWKKIDWVLNPKNLGVARHLPRFAPAMLEGAELYRHHFIWPAVGPMEYEWRPLPGVAFRPLDMDDVALLHRWVNDPALIDIWNQGKEQSLEAVEAKYGPYIRGEKPTQPYIIMHGGVPIGYIQTYLWRDYPDYAAHLGAEEESASLDVMIGEAEYRNRGLGRDILRAFLRGVVFSRPQVASCIITPEESNRRALRAYEKAGFKLWKVIDHPDEPSPVALMRITRDELFGGT